MKNEISKLANGTGRLDSDTCSAVRDRINSKGHTSEGDEVEFQSGQVWDATT